MTWLIIKYLTPKHCLKKNPQIFQILSIIEIIDIEAKKFTERGGGHKR